jgi:hypothetical protein
MMPFLHLFEDSWSTLEIEQELQPKVHNMEKSSKRGKIPQHDWPSIIKRYEAGETLASIARTYDCSPPAISYIVSRSRTRESTAEGRAMDTTGASEAPQATSRPSEEADPEGSGGASEIKTIRVEDLSSETSIPTEGTPIEPQQTAPTDPMQDTDASRADVPGAGGAIKREDTYALSERNLKIAPASSQLDGGEPRRTLHLSLSQEGARRSDTQRQHSPLGAHSSTSGTIPIDRSAGSQQHGFLQPNRGRAADHTLPANGGSLPMMTEPHPAKDVDTFIDHALRDRVDSDITAFLVAFDAALADDTPESRAGLRDATDRLLRAGARTRIQLERLEARVPLSPRDGHSIPTWRVR